MPARLGACAVLWQLMHAETLLSTGPFSRPSTPRCALAYAGADGLIQDSTSGCPVGIVAPHQSDGHHLQPRRGPGDGPVKRVGGKVPAGRPGAVVLYGDVDLKEADGDRTFVRALAESERPTSPRVGPGGSRSAVRHYREACTPGRRTRTSSSIDPVHPRRRWRSTTHAQTCAPRARRSKRRHSCGIRPCCRQARQHRLYAPASCPARLRVSLSGSRCRKSCAAPGTTSATAEPPARCHRWC